jgi:hypothetical protein
MSAMMSNCLRMMMVSLLWSAATTSMIASAAEAVPPTREPGTLSQDATSAGPAVDTSAATPAAETKPAARRPAAGGPQAVTRPNNDRLDLDTTVVTGNRELPKVLYIVPWKKSDLGDLPAQPFNTLLDEALTPVDRDVFRREVTYYGAVNGAAGERAVEANSAAERSEK